MTAPIFRGIVADLHRQRTHPGDCCPVAQCGTVFLVRRFWQCAVWPNTQHNERTQIENGTVPRFQFLDLAAKPELDRPMKKMELLASDLTVIGVPPSDVSTIVAALSAHPDNVEYWMGVAAQLRAPYFDETAFHASELVYRLTLECFPLTERLANNYGVLLLNWGRLSEAAEWFERGTRINPDYQAARSNLEHARSLLDEAMGFRPSDANPTVALGLPRGMFFRAGVIPDVEVWPYRDIWTATLEGIEATPNPFAASPPRVFLSYRSESQHLSDWLWRLASDLVERGYQVVYDRAYGLRREELGIPMIHRQLLESSYFVAILTERYRQSVEFRTAKDLSAQPIVGEDSVTLDEWVAAMLLAALGRNRMIGIWHSGVVLPPPFSAENVIDGREASDYGKVLEAFPRLNGQGELRQFVEPSTMSARSRLVTRSGAVTIMDHKLNLDRLSRVAVQARRAIVRNVG